MKVEVWSGRYVTSFSFKGGRVVASVALDGESSLIVTVKMPNGRLGEQCISIEDAIAKIDLFWYLVECGFEQHPTEIENG